MNSVSGAASGCPKAESTPSRKLNTSHTANSGAMVSSPASSVRWKFGCQKRRVSFIPVSPVELFRQQIYASAMTRYLITSALPYINGVKHLGNLVGSLLPADVFARFCRARGFETLALCATDEHGSTTELAAAELGQDVRAFCDEQYALQKAAGDGFGLSWDHFGRSSNAPNIALTQHFARLLWQNGHLEVRTTQQVYSNADKRFLSDRYVVGTCPHCGYDRARGDQCENCTRVLDPVDLINPRSAISGSPDIEVRDSTHLFLKQSEFVPQLRAWIESHEGEWPVLVTSIAKKWLDEGLQDRGITRDVEWGVPVPDDIADGQLKGKVFYVWFDAPIEYIACAQEWADANGKGDAWRDWWIGPKSKDVVYCEFMGKDNIRSTRWVFRSP